MKSHRGSTLIGLVIVACLASSGVGVATAVPSRASSAATTVARAPWRLEILHRMNGVRQALGVEPLRSCRALEVAAQAYAVSMATTDRFAHTDAAGAGVGDRMRVAGYRATASGENIAAGYVTPATVMTGWITSPGHFANLTNPAFRHVGIGRAIRAGSHYGTYWVLEFGAGGPC